MLVVVGFGTAVVVVVAFVAFNFGCVGIDVVAKVEPSEAVDDDSVMMGFFFCGDVGFVPTGDGFVPAVGFVPIVVGFVTTVVGFVPLDVAIDDCEVAANLVGGDGVVTIK